MVMLPVMPPMMQVTPKAKAMTNIMMAKAMPDTARKSAM